MGHIEASKDLSASPDAVWTTISNPNTWSDWFTVQEKWLQEPPAELTEGAHLSAKIVMLGMSNKIEWTITCVQPLTRLALQGTGMAGVKAEFAFIVEPTGEGTRFTVTGDFEGAMIKGALAKAVEKDGAKQLDKSLAQLDALASATA